MKACLLQIRFQFGVLIDCHAGDDFSPFLVFIRIAVAFVADKKYPSGLQHTPNLSKALRQILPEIDGFKRCDRIETVISKNHIRHTAMQNFTVPLGNGFFIDFF